MVFLTNLKIIVINTCILNVYGPILTGESCIGIDILRVMFKRTRYVFYVCILEELQLLSSCEEGTA